MFPEPEVGVHAPEVPDHLLEEAPVGRVPKEGREEPERVGVLRGVPVQDLVHHAVIKLPALALIEGELVGDGLQQVTEWSQLVGLCVC